MYSQTEQSLYFRSLELLINSLLIRRTPLSIKVLEHASPHYWEKKALQHFGEDGQGSFLDMECSVLADLAFMNISRRSTLMCQWIRTKAWSFSSGSASAEVIANVALCPFEAIQVRVQAQPQFAKGLADGFPKMYMTEDVRGYRTVKSQTYSSSWYRFSYCDVIASFSFLNPIFSLYRGLIPLWGHNLPCKLSLA